MRTTRLVLAVVVVVLLLGSCCSSEEGVAFHEDDPGPPSDAYDDYGDEPDAVSFRPLPQPRGEGACGHGSNLQFFLLHCRAAIL